MEYIFAMYSYFVLPYDHCYTKLYEDDSVGDMRVSEYSDTRSVTASARSSAVLWVYT